MSKRAGPSLSKNDTVALQSWESFCENLNNNIHMNHDEWDLGDKYPFNCSKVKVFQSFRTLVGHESFPPNGDTRYLVVQGHPGIGKSTSIVVMMKRCMMLRKPFLFSEENLGYSLGWDEENGGQLYREDWPYMDPKVTWIMNQKANGPYKGSLCNIVVVCSPERDNFSEFVKWCGVECQFLYMPLPTEIEVFAAAKLFGLNEDEIEDRIAMYGRVPRSVVSNQGYIARQLNEAIAVPASSEDISYLSCAGAHNFNFKNHCLSHCVFYQDAEVDLSEAHSRRFGTPYILSEYMLMWRQFSEQSFLQFISSVGDRMNAERGTAFEQLCHEVFKGGVTLQSFRLHNVNQVADPAMTQFQVVIPAYDAAHVRRISNRDLYAVTDLDMYLQPKHSNYPAVDSLVMTHTPGVANGITVNMYQMTINANHGMGRKALGKVMAKLRVAFPHAIWSLNLYYVVPIAMAGNYQQQPYTGNEVVPDIEDGAPININDLNLIVQYVIGVPIAL